MLANTSGSENSGQAQQKHFLTFELVNQKYALPLEAIMQIIPIVAITSIQQFDPLILGIINVRGMLVPVIDMQKLLNFPKTELHLHTPILLVNYQGHTLGLIVKAVNDILTVTESEIINPKNILPQELLGENILQGLITGETGTIIVLSGNHLFTARQKNIVEQATHLIATMETSDENGGDPGNRQPTAHPNGFGNHIETVEITEAIAEPGD